MTNHWQRKKKYINAHLNTWSCDIPVRSLFFSFHSGGHPHYCLHGVDASFWLSIGMVLSGSRRGVCSDEVSMRVPLRNGQICIAGIQVLWSWKQCHRRTRIVDLSEYNTASKSFLWMRMGGRGFHFCLEMGCKRNKPSVKSVSLTSGEMCIIFQPTELNKMIETYSIDIYIDSIFLWMEHASRLG